MNVLVFDANVSFAREAVNFIEDRVKGAKADMASNIFILRQRLRDRNWDFVLADVAAAMSMEAVIDELNKLDCPVIVWSTLTDTLSQRKGIVDKFKLIGKPKTEEQFSKALGDLVHAG
jgi:hypothetical protein